MTKVIRLTWEELLRVKRLMVIANMADTTAEDIGSSGQCLIEGDKVDWTSEDVTFELRKTNGKNNNEPE